jgi:hypothetical protein
MKKITFLHRKQNVMRDHLSVSVTVNPWEVANAGEV